MESLWSVLAFMFVCVCVCVCKGRPACQQWLTFANAPFQNLSCSLMGTTLSSLLGGGGSILVAFPVLVRRGISYESGVEVTEGSRHKNLQTCWNRWSYKVVTIIVTGYTQNSMFLSSSAVSAFMCLWEQKGVRKRDLPRGLTQTHTFRAAVACWEQCLVRLGPCWLCLMANLDRQGLPGTNCSGTWCQGTHTHAPIHKNYPVPDQRDRWHPAWS